MGCKLVFAGLSPKIQMRVLYYTTEDTFNLVSGEHKNRQNWDKLLKKGKTTRRDQNN